MAFLKLTRYSQLLSWITCVCLVAITFLAYAQSASTASPSSQTASTAIPSEIPTENPPTTATQAKAPAQTPSQSSATPSQTAPATPSASTAAVAPTATSTQKPSAPGSTAAPATPTPAPAPAPTQPSVGTLAPLALDNSSTNNEYQIYSKSKYTNPKWDSLVKEGFDQFNSGQALMAVDFLQKAVAQGSSSPLVYLVLAATYEFLGNPYTAIQYYALAEPNLNTLPSDCELVATFDENYGRALLGNNQSQDAIPHLEKVAKTTKEYWVLSVLADTYLAANNFDAALPVMLRATEVPTIQNVPTVEIAKLYLAIAKVYSAKGNENESARFIDYAIQTDPNNPEAAALSRQLSQKRRQNQLYDQMENMQQWYRK